MARSHGGAFDTSRTTMTDGASNLTQNAQQPAKVTVDGITAEQHPLTGQVAVDKYAEAKGARQDPRKALMRFRIKPPGAVN
jgi:hypothetical protein